MLPAAPRRIALGLSSAVSGRRTAAAASAVIPARVANFTTASRLPALRAGARRPPLALPTGARSASSTPHGDPGIAPGIEVRDLTDSEYHDVADEDMDRLHEGLEIMCEDYGSGTWEVEYSSGVMTLLVPPYGTYVINKQPPNHQIWVSSPVSGPQRFSVSPDGVWVHHRKQGVQLGALLEGELRDLLKERGEGAEWEGVGLK